jgi:hypothetical protein
MIIGEWIRRLGYLLRQAAAEDELRREMEAHRAQMAEPRDFGNTLRLRDEARDAWGWRWLDDFVKDTRFALRTLRHSPGFALTAVLTLALGIGANIGMFTLINTLLLRPAYERSGEVVGVYSRSTTPDGGYRGPSYPNYLDLREGSSAIFSNLSAFSGGFEGLDAGDGARRTLAFRVTANYFQFFGLPLALGRPFSTEEARLVRRLAPDARVRHSDRDRRTSPCPAVAGAVGGRPRHGHRHRTRPAAGPGRRAVPPRLPVRSERIRTHRAGDSAADPARRIAPGVVSPGAARHKSRSDSRAALRVMPGYLERFQRIGDVQE